MLNLAVQRRAVLFLFGLLVLGGLLGLRGADPLPLEAARENSFDLFQRLAPRAPGDFPVRIIDIDEASLQALGQWPWPRDRLALMAERLAGLGAAAIVFDLFFAEPDRSSPSRIAEALDLSDVGALPDHDAMFAEVLARTPSVLAFSRATRESLPERPKGGTAISGLDPTPALPVLDGAVLPLPELGQAARGLGVASLAREDTVSIVRRVPMLWSGNGQLFPTLSIEALRVAANVETLVVLGETAEPAFLEGLRVGPFSVPTGPRGEFWVYFREPRLGDAISAAVLLGDEFQGLAPQIAGQIVLIGTSASGLGDLRGTPLGRNFPGVAIHAQVLEQILSNTFLNRADWVSGLELVGFAGLGLLLLLAVILAGPFWSLVVALGFGGLVAGGAWAMFLHQRLLLDPSFPLLGLFTLYSAMLFARYLTADRDRRKIRAAFSHYVAPALLAEIERNRASLKLGGEIRELTVMFADVRGFTTLSENTTPRELVGTLNILFSALGEEITRRSGTIDKFIGDAIMAFWNAPLDVEDHPRMACLAALGMRESLARLNDSNGFGLGPGRTVTIGIGISTGEALVGNMGLETRFDYSCVGDTVNVASRVEGACKVVGYDVVVVDSTRSAAPELAFLDAGSIALKGKAARALIHILVGDAALARSPTFKALESAHRTAIARLGQGRIADDAMAQCLALSRSVDPRLQEFYRLLPERQEDFACEALSDDFEAKAARLLGT